MTAGSPLRPAVGYVLGAFPVLSETFVSGEMRAMAALGARVETFAFDLRRDACEPATAALVARARRVADLPDALSGAVSATGVGRALRLVAALPRRERLSALRAGLRIAAAARKAGCAWLHSHFGGGAALHALIAARLAGLGASFTVHSGAFLRNFPSPALAGPMAREADFCVGVTAALTENLRAAGARHAALVPCGADLRRFAAAASPPPNGRLLFVGRLIDCKGADDLLDALALLPAAARPGLDLVGEGPERPALEAQARRLGLDAAFLGARPNAWFAANGGAYRALAAPFRTGRDGQRDSAPVVLKEAMALGLPIVSTRLPGVVETVVDAALLADPANPASLSRELAALDSEARRRLGTAGRMRAARFGLDAQAGALLALIEGARCGGPGR